MYKLCIIIFFYLLAKYYITITYVETAAQQYWLMKIEFFLSFWNLFHRPCIWYSVPILPIIMYKLYLWKIKCNWSIQYTLSKIFLILYTRWCDISDREKYSYLLILSSIDSCISFIFWYKINNMYFVIAHTLVITFQIWICSLM